MQSDYVLDITGPEVSGLRSEQAIQASVGLERDLGREPSVRVEGYYKRFDDLLIGRLEPESERLARVGRYDFPPALADSVPVEPIITTVPTNDGRGRAYGFDLFVSRTTAPADARVRGWASYTWGRADRDAYGRSYPFEYDRRHAFSAVASYRLSNRWEIASTRASRRDFRVPRRSACASRARTIPTIGIATASPTNCCRRSTRRAAGLRRRLRRRVQSQHGALAAVRQGGRARHMASARPGGTLGALRRGHQPAEPQNAGAVEAVLEYDPASE